MSDNLVVFSQSYSGVTGFKVKDSDDNTLTYIRPQGTKSISANGTGIDVAGYATADVSVPTGTARSSSDLTASGLTVTAPAGLYASAATKTLSDANLVAGNIKKDISIFGVTGSYEGSGGSSYTLLASQEFTVSTTSTTAASIGTMSVPNSYLSSKIIYVRVRDKAGARNGYLYGTDSYFLNYKAVRGGTDTLSIYAFVGYTASTGTGRLRYAGYSSTICGVYPKSITSDGVINIYSRYSSGNSKTINGTYVVDVYSLDPPAGTVIFE